MQKWEYLFLIVDRESGGLLSSPGSWKVRKANGEEVPDWTSGPELHEFCNRLGAKGWEMIGFSQSPVFDQHAAVSHHNFRIVMKRPLE